MKNLFNQKPKKEKIKDFDINSLNVESKRITISKEFDEILNNDKLNDDEKEIISKLKLFILKHFIKDNNKLITKKQKNGLLNFGFEEMDYYITVKQQENLMYSGQVKYIKALNELRIGLAQAKMFHTHYLKITINDDLLNKINELEVK